MKRTLQVFFICLSLCLPGFLSAQITIDNSTFPAAGDTLRTITDNLFMDFDATQVGEQTWDMRALDGGFLIETIYEDPSEGSAGDLFPDADMLDRSTGQEIYYETFGNKIVEIGRSGLDPVLNVLDLTYNNDGESVLRRAPLGYNNNYNDQSSFQISASTEIIPDSILPGLGALVDSLRLTVSTANENDIDAYGTLRLPDNDYEVLRQKSVTTTDAGLEIFTAFFGWQPVDPNNPLFEPLGDVLDLLGETVTTSYQFFGNTEKEILADIQVDEEGMPLLTTYKGDMTTAVEVIKATDENILTYPNPTYGDVTFELRNLPKDNYRIEIYNIIGKKLWSSDIDRITGRLVTNVSHLRKGTYLYSIMDSKGHKITTRRLMIITP